MRGVARQARTELFVAQHVFDGFLHPGELAAVDDFTGGGNDEDDGHAALMSFAIGGGFCFGDMN